MKKYNKLVRDKIPEIIKADDCIPKIKILGKKEFKKAILEKLLEESKEITQSQSRKEMINELADVQEVMLSIYDTFDIECSEVTKVARQKRKSRGAFTKRIFLESVK